MRETEYNGGRFGSFTAGDVKRSRSIGIVHNNIPEVCGTSRLVTALALTYRWGSMGFDRFIDFLPDAEHLSAVDKSAFADILGESAWSLT